MNHSTDIRHHPNYTSSSIRQNKNSFFKAAPGPQGLSARRLTIDPQLIQKLSNNLMGLNDKLSTVLSPKSKLRDKPLSRLETVASEVMTEPPVRSGRSNLHQTIKLSSMFKLNNKLDLSKKLKSKILLKPNLTDKSAEVRISRTTEQLRFLDVQSPQQSSAPILKPYNPSEPRKGISISTFQRQSQMIPPLLEVSSGNIRLRSKFKGNSLKRDFGRTMTEEIENETRKNINDLTDGFARASQVITFNHRRSTLPPADFIRCSRTPNELSDIWKNTTVVDPCFIKSKIILSLHESKISQMIDNRMTENYQSMRALGAQICKKFHTAVVKITEPVKEEFHQKRRAILEKVWNLIKFIISCKIPSELIFQFPSRPFQNPKSVEFIEAAKLGKSDRISELLVKESPLLVYEYDHFRLTALHWAAIRNLTSCGSVLLTNNSFTNGVDSYGRSPLYYAIKSQNVILVYMMLVKHASPWSPKHTNYFELANKHDQIIYFLKRFRSLELMLMFQMPSERDAFREYYIANRVKRPY
jgi:hypothetical protein